MDGDKNHFQSRRVKEIEERLKALPKGTLVYKNIKGKQQPYLQRTEKGKSISVYIKKEGREQILALIEERKRLQEELEYLRTYQESIALILMNNPYLANKPGIGYQQFDTFIEGNMMYVDKTHFIKEWWESDVQITLINRPRRFGKTLMLSTVECFLSTRYKNREDLFEKLNIWKWEKYRRLQGTRPVIFMTFAAVKSNNLKGAVYSICEYLFYLYNTHSYLLEEDILSTEDKDLYQKTVEGLKNREPDVCKNALLILCYLLYQFYSEKVVILLDEYDTPLQEAYLAGYWGEMTDFIRALFNSTFKSNQYLDKALMTGITRVAKESLFSDINNLRIYTTTSKQYADVFGYTRQEVEDSLQCQNIEELETVKEWYDGYTFGGITDMYNPWAINCYISSRECQLFWANTGGYSLASRLIMNGSNRIKEEFEILLRGDKIHKVLDENVTFDELDYNQNAIWSLLLAAGYLKADNVRFDGMTECDLSITNKETKVLFQKMVTQWFARVDDEYDGFCKALVNGDVELVDKYMNYVALDMISVFDVGKRPSEKAPDRFYHGLVLGLIVKLRDEYEITSNRESGYGRYDIMMRPKKEGHKGIIIEFKVRDEKREATLEETLQSALGQIEKQAYERELLGSGIHQGQILKYGFAFEGKTVLIGTKNQ